MLRRSDLADDGIIDQGPGKWAAHCHLFSGIPLLSPFIQFPCGNIWQEKRENVIWCACVFYLELLEYDCCTSRHRPQSERNCIRQQYREDFIGLPIPTKQIQFPDKSQQKQHNFPNVSLPHLHLLDNGLAGNIVHNCQMPVEHQTESRESWNRGFWWDCNLCAIDLAMLALSITLLLNYVAQ